MQGSTQFCMGTDAMNGAPWEPFMGMWYLISGKTLIPGVAGVPPEQRLTRLEALRSHTSGCGWFLDQEGRLGTLEKGRHADLIVPSADYFTVPEDEIKDLRSHLTIVGGRIVHAEGEFTNLANQDAETIGVVAGSVPQTLSLSVAAPAMFPAFQPGTARTYTATTTANVISSAGDAALTVSDPGRLTNGAFSLSQPLQVGIAPNSWTTPVSNATSTITFTQPVTATEPLRTGVYSRTLMFTLSTTTP